MSQWVSAISVWLIAGIVALILTAAFVRRVPVYESFVEGAKDGFQTSVDLIPHLVGMMVAVTVFRESGAMEGLIALLSPLLSWVGLPPEVLPLALLRPISGAGSLGVTTDIIKTYGPDSFLGRLAATIGSTDTTLYILTVYFGAVGIKKVSYALKVGLLADAVGILSSLYFVHLVFG